MMIRFLSLATVVFLSNAARAILVAENGTAWTVGQPVQTTSGLVSGKVATLAGNAQVSEYLGIPFAAAPVGILRWAPPQPFKGTTPISATKFGPGCPSGGGQSGSNSLGTLSGGSQNEDCLFLNVWTKPQSGEKAKAVMMSIYGGGFNSGDSNNNMLNGAPLANLEDVIVVSMNYRLNILGFPGAPGLTDQNLGLLDIRASVEWVRDNIAAFGGDPKRIILFGESAGGGAVDYYAHAWEQDPIVAGFIPQSGAVFMRGIAVSSNTKSWYNTSISMGCGGPEVGETSLECMRSKDWKSVMKYVDTGMRQEGKTFGPTFDEKIVFKDYAARDKAGHFIKRPMLIGSNHNEGGIFKMMKNISKTDMVAMNLCFTCPAATAAKARVDHNVPVWRYRYFGDWPNMRISQDAGAWHGSELALVYGTPKILGSLMKDTDDEKALTKVMMNAWASFAKDPENGLKKLGWPLYEPNGTTLIQLGYNNGPGMTLGSPTQYDADCPKYEISGDSLDAVMSRSPDNVKGMLGGALGGLLGGGSKQPPTAMS